MNCRIPKSERTPRDIHGNRSCVGRQTTSAAPGFSLTAARNIRLKFPRLASARSMVGSCLSWSITRIYRLGRHGSGSIWRCGHAAMPVSGVATAGPLYRRVSALCRIRDRMDRGNRHGYADGRRGATGRDLIGLRPQIAGNRPPATKSPAHRVLSENSDCEAARPSISAGLTPAHLSRRSPKQRKNQEASRNARS